MTNTKIAAKIRALRALAEHPGTPEHERLRASEKMTELMEKYAIDELMLREDHGTSDKISMREYVRVGSYWQVEKENVCALAGALDMQSLYFPHSGYGKQQVRIRVWGFDDDFVKFEALLASMTLQLEQAWKVFRKSFSNDDLLAWRTGTDMYRFKTRRSYMVGYGRGFASRVKAGRNHAVQASAGTGAELVLVDRAIRVQIEFEQANPSVKAGRSMLLNRAFYDGQAAGKNARTGEDALGGKGELQ